MLLGSTRVDPALGRRSYLGSARPVASREIAARVEIDWGASTVRAELAALEVDGYLQHPHTSAGRIPTEAGYRHYVDMLVEAGPPVAAVGVELQLSRLRREVDEAMRETTDGAGPGHRPDGDGYRPAAERRRDDPPGRGAAPAAKQGDVDRDCLNRGVAKRVFDFEARSTRAWSSGPPAT